MRLKVLQNDYSFCKLSAVPVDINVYTSEFSLLSVTPDEISLFCATDKAPANTVQQDDGWMVFKIDAVMEFGLVGIMAKLSGVLASAGVSILAMVSFDTDYVGIKRENETKAWEALRTAGYEIVS